MNTDLKLRSGKGLVFWFSIFGNSGDFGNLFLLLSAWHGSAHGSSVQSVVQKVFPRLLIEMFSSQMRGYTKLLFDAKDCQ
jgi:hypothetical protein